jgi:hypothetical protein
MGVGVAGVGVDGVVVVIEEEGARERGERGVEDGGGESVRWQRRAAMLCHAQPQEWYVIDLKPYPCKLLWCNG